MPGEIEVLRSRRVQPPLHKIVLRSGWPGLGDDARALRIYDRLAIGDASVALEVMRLRRDVPALQRVAEESLPI